MLYTNEFGHFQNAKRIWFWSICGPCLEQLELQQLPLPVKDLRLARYLDHSSQFIALTFDPNHGQLFLNSVKLSVPRCGTMAIVMISLEIEVLSNE